MADKLNHIDKLNSFYSRLMSSKNNIEYYRNEIKNLINKQDWTAAEALCEEALEKLFPQISWLFLYIGQVYFGKGYFQEARHAFNLAKQLEPGNAWVYYHSAEMFINRNKTEKAIPEIMMAVNLAPVDFLLQKSINKMLSDLECYNVAQKILEHISNRYYQNPWGYFFAGEILIYLNKPELAKECYRKASEKIPDSDTPFSAYVEYADYLCQLPEKIRSYNQENLNNDRLKVLILVPFAPFDQTGGCIRLLEELKYMSQHYNVVLVTFLYSKQDIVKVKAFEKYPDLCVFVIDDEKGGVESEEIPKSVQKKKSLRMENSLKELSIIKFDWVIFNFIYMAQYRKLFPDSFTILAEHNIESELVIKSDAHETYNNGLQDEIVLDELFSGNNNEYKLLSEYENKFWPAFNLRTVVSEVDYEIIRKRCPTGKSIIVPNGADISNIKLLDIKAVPRLLFMGSLNYYPNIDAVHYFMEEIMKHIWEQNPAVEFWIAGKSPGKSIRGLDDNSRVRVIPSPPDMNIIAAECCLSVVPLRLGSGTRIKILNSMAMGMPVVSTSLGAEGLMVRNRENIILEDEPAKFAGAVLELLNDSLLWEKLRSNGRLLVEEHYDWDTIYKNAMIEYHNEYEQWFLKKPVS
jgi:glycosyltransferase involved in cell wall biosynthesis